jgi:predicted site-specific integrase-resolvase
MKKTYSTREAAAKIGVAFITVNRWIRQKKIVPSIAFPIGAGQKTMWRWTEGDIARARRIDQTPGRKPKAGAK